MKTLHEETAPPLVLASASALPLTIERLQRWARGLEQRGMRLVPVSAVPAARGQITGTARSTGAALERR